ncbi:MAG: hypothetical protein CL824_04660 [Crocinitomicaceae bacterium]|nr:hypothetical protein [Crocinitomicaceae bacterium]
MISAIKKESIIEKLILFFIISIFCIPKITAIAGILFFSSFLYISIKKKLTFRLNRELLFFIVLYLLYIIGMLMSNDQSNFKHIIESKIVFLILPLVFSIGYHKSYNHKNIHLSIVLSIIAYSIYGIYNGLLWYFDNDISNPYFGTYYCFTRGILSPLTHPSYDAAYVFLGVLSTLSLYKNGHLKKYISILILIFLSLKIMLLFSFSGILFYFIFLLIMVFWYAKNRWNLMAGFSILSLLFLCIFFLLNNVPMLKTDFNNAKNHSISYISDPQGFIEKSDKNPNGTVIRIIMWKVSYDLIKENPLGYGVGDAMYVTNSKLKKYGFDEMVKHDLNPHNQYLQIGLELGIFPLLIFIFGCLYLLVNAWKSKNHFLLFIVLNLIFNCCFESMLQRQSGIVFYTFFICLFLQWNVKENRLL